VTSLLPFQRIAVTVPPAHWFHGITRATYEIYRRALEELGAAVFEVPIDAFVPGDAGRISDLVEDLRAFRPQLALGVPYLSHALVCRLASGKGGWRPNLFTDVLDIPTLGAWDHAPFELADQLLTPLPASPAQSRNIGGALQRSLRADRLVHWSRDSGQIGLMRRFGLLSHEPVLEMTPALPATRYDPPARIHGPRVAFVGHFYPVATDYDHPELNRLAHDSIAEWLKDGGTMWAALDHCLDRLPADLAHALRLEPDQSFFWAFAHRTVLHTAHSANRLHVLEGIDLPVACYSGAKSLTDAPSNLMPVPGHIPFGPALDEVFARHPIVVDVVSPGFGQTISQKLFRAFDAGGFMLVDRKPDFIQAFGDLAEAVSYSDRADLAAKIDFYLSKPARRREVAEAMRARIAHDRSLPDVLRRVIERAAEHPATSFGPSAAMPLRARGDERVDVLSRLRRSSMLGRARCRRSAGRVTISSPGPHWQDAAIMTVQGCRVDLRLRVETGQAFVGLLSGREMASYHIVSPSRHAVDLSFDIPGLSAAMIEVRSASAHPCRLVMTGASLIRDRVPDSSTQRASIGVDYSVRGRLADSG
jgi:Glycosyl transferases group 1